MAVERIDRRQFIRRAGLWCLAGAAATGAGAVLSGITGCGSGQDQAEEIGGKPKEVIDSAARGVDPCDDVSMLSDAELAVRENFEYVPRSDVEGEYCNNCEFWTEPTGAGPCGGCTLMKGPINPKGHCISWAEIQS
jgi:hypothetical protein